MDDERRKLIDTLAAAPERAREAALSARGKPRPAGEWSLNAVIGHLAHVEDEVWRARFKQMAAGENPGWNYWEPDGIDWEGLYGSRPLGELLDDFAVRRGASLAHLQGLDEAGWRRQGTHSRWGPVDVARLCQEMAKHDEAHLGQLAKHD